MEVTYQTVLVPKYTYIITPAGIRRDTIYIAHTIKVITVVL